MSKYNTNGLSTTITLQLLDEEIEVLRQCTVSISGTDNFATSLALKIAIALLDVREKAAEQKTNSCPTNCNAKDYARDIYYGI